VIETKQPSVAKAKYGEALDLLPLEKVMQVTF
jgi:hypothetical protein